MRVTAFPPLKTVTKLGDKVGVLVDEDGAAMLVEGIPDRGFRGLVEDEEVAVGAAAEVGSDGFELGGEWAVVVRGV
ncbi:hypothetical protein RHSIM_Rhsim04G0137900 [Rhododendron simsii]|uniref:Uncharacterized protein n=1 Tax=Rhododendron simsii TaxID=118357 RepID=A0A834H279_RHOSS|nr:hypothetical protein RHSIM_Rhsim04G0137900 [Rhododendron simsii]